MNIPEIKVRFERLKAIRDQSNADRIMKMADSTYLVIPRLLSEKRRYIPIGFMSPEVIAGDACSIIPNVSIYEFVLLTLSVHMAWIRVVAGRLKCDIRCSPAVSNNMS